MATIYHYFDKDTFVPEKNYFSTEHVKCSRQEDETEMHLNNQAYKWSCIGFNCIGWGGLVGIILMITFGILGSSISSWYFIGAVVGSVFFMGGIIFANAVCWPKESEYNDKRREYYTEHAEELWAEATKEIRVYNEEQEQVFCKWRI